MNQREAVIEVMKANGGFATLGYLYCNLQKLLVYTVTQQRKLTDGTNNI